jgi:carbamoyl-phosphate synthase small subunit
VYPADDTESKQTHLGGVIVRDLSCVVSNYRSTQSLDEYLKEQVSWL